MALAGAGDGAEYHLDTLRSTGVAPPEKNVSRPVESERHELIDGTINPLEHLDAEDEYPSPLSMNHQDPVAHNPGNLDLPSIGGGHVDGEDKRETNPTNSEATSATDPYVSKSTTGILAFLTALVFSC